MQHVACVTGELCACCLCHLVPCVGGAGTIVTSPPSLQVRHYRASPQVQSKAEEVYARLKQMFLQPDQPVPPAPSLPRRRMLPAIGMRKRPGIDDVSNRSGISDIISGPSAQQLQQLSIPTVPDRQADTPSEGGATGGLEVCCCIGTHSVMKCCENVLKLMDMVLVTQKA